MGKCPKCGKPVTTVNIEDVTINHLFRPLWEGVSYLCPYCHSVLGVQTDPVKIKQEIVESVRVLLEERKS